MSGKADQYPGIARAALAIALDNGGMSRFRNPMKQRREMERWLANQEPAILEMTDHWLTRLSDEDLITVCAGGQDEPETIKLMEAAPPFADDLLNSYFEEVC